MKLFKISTGLVIEADSGVLHLATASTVPPPPACPPVDFDLWTNRDDLYDFLKSVIHHLPTITAAEFAGYPLLAPIGSQEVWCAGVTYKKSQEQRSMESAAGGNPELQGKIETDGTDFYARVYDAPRPEIFFKALAQRVSGPGEPIHVRRDSTWDVPEPELAIFMTSSSKIVAYSIGNDVSSRSIEGENPLYLPQAKTYERCMGLGPCLYIPAAPIDPDSELTLEIKRDGKSIFLESQFIRDMKRTLPELADYLFMECAFPSGAILSTGTSIIPEETFTLTPGDIVDISIDNIGTLSNVVAMRPASAKL